MSPTKPVDPAMAEGVAFTLGFESAEDRIRHAAGQLFAEGEDEKAAAYREAADLLRAIVSKMHKQFK